MPISAISFSCFNSGPAGLVPTRAVRSADTISPPRQNDGQRKAPAILHCETVSPCRAIVAPKIQSIPLCFLGNLPFCRATGRWRLRSRTLCKKREFCKQRDGVKRPEFRAQTAVGIATMERGFSSNKNSSQDRLPGGLLRRPASVAPRTPEFPLPRPSPAEIKSGKLARAFGQQGVG